MASEVYAATYGADPAPYVSPMIIREE